MYTTAHTTVDPNEIKKFQAWALRWWDEEGVYSALHSMNDLRVPFIRDTLISKSNGHELGCPLLGVKLLDVGCGGGLLTEGSRVWNKLPRQMRDLESYDVFKKELKTFLFSLAFST